MRRLLTVLVSLAGVVMGAPAPAGATMPIETYRTRMVHRINDVRAQHVRPSSCLQRQAQHYADRLADGAPFAHPTLGPTLYRCHSSMVGEVLFRGQLPPRLVVQAFLASPPHAMVFHNPYYRHVGVGVVRLESSWVVVVRFADEVTE